MFCRREQSLQRGESQLPGATFATSRKAEKETGQFPQDSTGERKCLQRFEVHVVGYCRSCRFFRCCCCCCHCCCCCCRSCCRSCRSCCSCRSCRSCRCRCSCCHCCCHCCHYRCSWKAEKETRQFFEDSAGKRKCLQWFEVTKLSLLLSLLLLLLSLLLRCCCFHSYCRRCCCCRRYRCCWKAEKETGQFLEHSAGERKCLQWFEVHVVVVVVVAVVLVVVVVVVVIVVVIVVVVFVVIIVVIIFVVVVIVVETFYLTYISYISPKVFVPFIFVFKLYMKNSF